MIKYHRLLIVCIMFATSCNKNMKQPINNSIPSPKADKIPISFKKHDDLRIDNYYWLNEKENPEVIDYLERENDYYNKMTAHTKDFQEKLFEEIKGKIKEDDQSVPYFINGSGLYQKKRFNKCQR
jgi:oligopeptidase B